MIPNSAFYKVERHAYQILVRRDEGEVPQGIFPFDLPAGSHEPTPASVDKAWADALELCNRLNEGVRAEAELKLNSGDV